MEENKTSRVEADIASNERNADTKQTSEIYEHVCDLLSPLRDRWLFIQQILIWRNRELSVIVFNILNVLFWIFLTPRLKLLVILAILLSLLWLTPPIRHSILLSIQSLSTGRAEKYVDSDDSAEVLCEGEQVKSSEKKITSYEDFCHGVAMVWSFVTNYWIKLKILKQENAHKFYLIISLLVVVIAVVYAQFPIGNILYLTVMSLYLWPAIVFYGIKDKVVRKVQKLFRPFFTQWQSSRTKRKREIVLQDHRQVSDISEDEDFTLKATKTDARPAISPEQRAKREQLTDPLDSVNSSLTFIDGLEFPSMRRDSTESFNSDDFVQGLNFSGITPCSHHSSMDSLVGENDGKIHSQNDETFHSQNDGTFRSQNDEAIHSQNDGMTDSQYDHLQTNEEYILPQSQPTYETEMRRRTNEQSASAVLPSRKKSTGSVESFEVIDTSEIQVDMNKDKEEQAQGDGSYIASGTAYMGKLFGYS